MQVYFQNYTIYKYLTWGNFVHFFWRLKKRRYRKVRIFFGTKVQPKKFKKKIRRWRKKGFFLRIHWKYKEIFFNHKFVFRIFKRTTMMGKLLKKLKKRLKKLYKKKPIATWFMSFFPRKTRLKKHKPVNFLKYYLNLKLLPRKHRLSTWNLKRKIFLTSKNLMYFFIGALYKSMLHKIRRKRLKRIQYSSYYPAKLNSPVKFFKPKPLVKNFEKHTKKNMKLRTRRKKILLHRKDKYRKNFVYFTKKNKKKMILCNYHKPIVWKLRSARFAHWKIRTHGTLNEWRYDKLLGAELGSYLNFFKKQLLNVIFVSLYACQLSWKQHAWFFTSKLILVNKTCLKLNDILKYGDIIELPYGPSLRRAKRQWRVKWRRKWRLIRRFAYKQKFWYKKKILKTDPLRHSMYKKSPMAVRVLGKLLAIDYGLKTIGVVKKIPTFSHTFDGQATICSVLTLQNWRFRFD